MKIKRNQKGFTLIEVVLVLAIGGLIFLLAFLAFQQVSRNRRDTQRRSAAGQIVAELQNFNGDTNKIPDSSVAVTSANLCTGGTAPVSPTFHYFVRTYLCNTSNEYKSPGGSNYAIAVTGAGALAADTLRFTKDANCDGAVTGGMKVEVGLESGIICRDNK